MNSSNYRMFLFYFGLESEFQCQADVRVYDIFPAHVLCCYDMSGYTVTFYGTNLCGLVLGLYAKQASYTNVGVKQYLANNYYNYIKALCYTHILIQ